SGWLPDLSPANNALRLTVPVAKGTTGRVWDEFLFNNSTTTQAHLAFKAASTEAGKATLLMRGRNVDAPTTVPAGEWEFVDAQTIRLLPAGTAFKIGTIYQLVYDVVDSPISGIGFAATRDLVSFLRYGTKDEAGTANPFLASGRPAIVRALAHGTSQSGRYLR